MKKTLIFIAVMLLAALVLSACGGGKDEPEAAPEAPAAAEESQEAEATEAEPAKAEAVAQGDAESGQKLYMATCSACHGPAGEGVQGLGKDMTTSEFIAGLSDAELIDFIKTGRDTNDPLNTTGVAMLPNGGNPSMTDEQLVDIVAYIRSIHN